MNKTKLKAYAPKARKDFIAAVTARANLLGLSEKSGTLEVALGERKGDIAIIAGREWPVKVYSQREDLIKRMTNDGFSHTVEAVAYTWFNRFAALRYMEIHDYLDHGHRALSNREGGMPEILNHAAELDLPGLNKAKAIELKLAGNKDNELYKLILVAQCNALSSAMPFLFERIDDETELLLPDNLLLTDSVIAELVADIPEEDWAEVEIIGWLYQFYISEKKDEVIGKVVKSEDIPAATQLFTPNWIVQYLVQNSIGRLWMMANPSSTLKSQWTYYIEPAEQTPEVQTQLSNLIQTRMDEDGGNLNPETITVLDPACGSGHILVVAYDVLKAIYLERGYQLRAIPRLILEKNIYGLDIDDRAAQMAGFALLMKARADDRRLFDSQLKLNVLSLQASKGMQLDQLASNLQSYHINRVPLAKLIDIFTHAKNFGSLINIPSELNVELVSMEMNLNKAILNGDLYSQAAAQDLIALVRQAKVLGMQFDSVVANPPYMGSKGMNTTLKDYAKSKFPDTKSDLFSIFIEHGFGWCKPSGLNSMVTMQSWMFLSSYESMRDKLLRSRSLSSMVHMGNGVMGIAFGTAATIFFKSHFKEYSGSFSYCDYDDLNDIGNPIQFPVKNIRLSIAKPDDFQLIPGSPIAYWASDKSRKAFGSKMKVSDVIDTREGLATADNDRFLRYWHEVEIGNIGLSCKTNTEAVQTMKKWFPYVKGGGVRRWVGNEDYVVNWFNDGEEIKSNIDAETGRIRSHNYNGDHAFITGLTWTGLSSSDFSVRYVPQGFMFDAKGPMGFPRFEEGWQVVIAFLNSRVALHLIAMLAPTMDFKLGHILNLPWNQAFKDNSELINSTLQAIDIARDDWDSNETSIGFRKLPFCNMQLSGRISLDWKCWCAKSIERFRQLQSIEQDNNRHFIETFGLQDELSPDVSVDQVTLTRADREKDCLRLISYAVGCMMGRYSLNEPGLIYARAGNVGFEPSRYTTFPADADGIIPITETLWFEDDAAKRTREFLIAVCGVDTLDENMAWLAESLGNKGNETPEETIRRYLTSNFYKNHLQTYKKRPIYWLFSSGKQGAFQALVYLHRYNEGTLARMRSEYVVPLTGKMLSRIEMLEKDASSEASTATRSKISKEIEVLRKQHIELLAYDEKLRHYADMRIQLDLDDGVKVNYGRFGDLLAEVKAITGGSADD